MSRLLVLSVILQLTAAQYAERAPIPLADVVDQVQRSLPHDAHVVDYVVVRGTVVGNNLVTRKREERSGRESLNSFAEIAIDIAHAESFGDVQSKGFAAALVDPFPVFYNSVSGEAVRTTIAPRPQPVYSESYAPVGSDVLFVAFRSKDGRRRGAWQPYMNESFAIVLALTRDSTGSYVAVVGPGEFDPRFAVGPPGTLVPIEAQKPELCPVEGSAEAVESRMIEAMRDLAR